MKKAPIKALFTDIGGVLMTNSWDHNSRKQAVKVFNLEKEVEDRHSLIASSLELGKFSLEEYLNIVIFYKKRSFTRAQFRKFMFDQSKPYPEMIELLRKLKNKYNLKIVVVSNETRELNDYRIAKFKLNSFMDFFVSSCYVGMRKPDPRIYRLALDTAQVPAEQILYLEDRLLFVEMAESQGICGIHHVDYDSTRKQFIKYGLNLDD